MIGIDLVDIKKFEEKKYIEKTFTKNELSYANKKDNKIQSLAGMFAAKEAIIKACDLNLSYILKKRIEIIHIDNKAYGLLDKKIWLNISISHEKDYAIAVCVLDKKPNFKIDKDVKKLVKKRDEFSHKGDFGKVAVIGGSKGMSGSVYLTSMASLRSGCGLSYIICPRSISKILQIKATESIIEEVSCEKFYYDEKIKAEVLSYLGKKDSLAIGPGMSRNKSLNKLLGSLIKNYDKNIVIDADGLNALSEDLSILKYKKNIVLTPHMMEFSRLTKLSIKEIEKNKVDIAKKFAKDHGIVLVLKGHNTIVTDGSYIYINKTGNSGMASAGSGDVLTGIILSNLAIMNPLDASILSVYIHGLAGDFAKHKLGEDSLIASDIVNNISEAYKILRK